MSYVTRFLQLVEHKYSRRFLLKDADFQKEQNDYYLAWALKYKTAQALLLLLLFVFTTLSLLFNLDKITYENLLYFAKDFNSAVDIAESNHNSIVYASINADAFALYKNGIAVVGDTEMSIYTATGHKTISRPVQYTAPQIETSGKYIMLYDLGGYELSIYHSFASIYEETFQYPITKAVFSDSGMFAVVTKSTYHPSSVILYNENFEYVNAYNKSSYVIDVSIAPGGNRIAMLSVTTTEGNFESELTLAIPGRDRILTSVMRTGAFPLGCAFCENGNLAVVFDIGVAYYTRDGELISEYLLPTGSTIAAMDVNAFGTALYLETEKTAVGQGYELLVFDQKGSLSHQESLAFPARAVALYEESVFVQTYTDIRKLALRDGVWVERETLYDGEVMVAYNSDHVILFSETKAWFVPLDH